jgi:hypothetical protein
VKVYDAVTFRIEKGEIHPDRQLLGTYFVSERMLERNMVKIMPLTPRYLMYALIRNEAKSTWWKFLRMMYFTGFVDIEETDRFMWKEHFTFGFIHTLRKRRKKINTAMMLKMGEPT